MNASIAVRYASAYASEGQDDQLTTAWRPSQALRRSGGTLPVAGHGAWLGFRLGACDPPQRLGDGRSGLLSEPSIAGWVDAAQKASRGALTFISLTARVEVLGPAGR